MESSRLAGPKRRLALAKKLTAAAAAVAFGLTFVAMRDGRATASTKSSSTARTATPAQSQAQDDFFGSSNVSPSSGSAPSVSSSTS